MIARRREFLRGLLASPASAGLVFSANAVPTGQSQSFRYKNPIAGVRVRDCQIIRENGVYTMTGTFPPFWGEKVSSGVRVIQSRDLKHWSSPQLVLRPDGWFQQLFWAPEIFPHAGRYYLTFNCSAGATNPIDWNRNVKISVGLAVADSVLGPYRVLTPHKPLVEGNDATLFLDRDGKTYLYHTAYIRGRSGIGCTLVDLKKGCAISDTTICLSKSPDPGWDGGDNVDIEGPSVFKRGPIYYLMYSSWGRGYEVGYATARSPLGPWAKSKNNPIFGAQDREWAQKHSGVYAQSPEVPFGQVGHGSPFFGPDGRIWFSCHGIMQKNRGYDLEPHPVFAPLNFTSDGGLDLKLTWTEQVIDLSHVVTDPSWHSSGSPASTPT